VLPAMIEAGEGGIVNISSLAATVGLPNLASYSASKAGIHGLTRHAAVEYGKAGIRVNAIAPGPFHSRLTDTTSEAVKKSVQTYIPVNRAGEAEDVQGVCVFLASRAGAYVNGSTIALDGGYIAAL